MLFILNKQRVPSLAAVIQIGATVADPLSLQPGALAAAVVPPAMRKTTAQQDADIQASEPSPPVVAGITPTCPYGLSACWAGAFDALKHLQAVRLVRPLPNPDDCTAFLYLNDGELPNVDLWRQQFASLANGTYLFRGVEVTLKGTVSAKPDGGLLLAATGSRPTVLLEPIQASDKIQWDLNTHALKPLTAAEQNAFAALQQQVHAAGGSLDVSVTGPFKVSGQTSEVEVREFDVV
jgi:galactose oxidase